MKKSEGVKLIPFDISRVKYIACPIILYDMVGKIEESDELRCLSVKRTK